MLTTKQKGEIAYIKCALRAVELGFTLSKPTTDARYDVIIDEDNKLQRAQIKYAGGTAHTATADFRRRSHSTGANTRTYSAAEIDLMLVYVPAIDKVLRLGPALFDGKPSIIIRLTPTKNNQRAKVIMAGPLIW